MDTFTSTTNNNQSTLTLEKLMDCKRKVDALPKPIISSPDIYPSEIVPPDYTIVSMPSASKNRSKRLWKKLASKIFESRSNGYNKVWCIMGKMYAHPTVLRALCDK